MELKIQNNEIKNVDFQNRKMRNKARVDFSSSREQMVYAQVTNFRICNKTADVLFDLRAEPHILKGIQGTHVCQTYTPKHMDKKLEIMLDQSLKIKAGGKNPDTMDVTDLLAKDILDISEVMNAATSFDPKLVLAA